MLTGEGADELFAGYDVFRENAVRHFWAREPESKLRPLLFARLNEFIAGDLKRSGAFVSSFYGRGLTDTDDPLYSHGSALRTPRARSACSTPASSSAPAPPTTRLRA